MTRMPPLSLILSLLLFLRIPACTCSWLSYDSLDHDKEAHKPQVETSCNLTQMQLSGGCQGIMNYGRAPYHHHMLDPAVCRTAASYCSNNSDPLAEIISIDYQAEAVSDTDQHTVVLVLLNRTFNGPPHSCLQISPFGQIQKYLQLTLHYKCTAAGLKGAWLNLSRLSCPADTTGNLSDYYITADNMEQHYASFCQTPHGRRRSLPLRSAIFDIGYRELGKWGSMLDDELTAISDHVEELSLRCALSGGVCEYKSNTSHHPNSMGGNGGFPQAGVNVLPKAKKSRMKLMIGGLVAAGGMFIAIILLILYSFHKWKILISRTFKNKKQSKRNQQVEAFLEKFGCLAPKRYSYSDVEKMTTCFSEQIGQGGFGKVYKGKLTDDQLVAVKVLNDYKGSGKEFFNEVISIGCTFHVNIVSLLGFCLEGSKRVLIYEFMTNGSLDKLIYSEKQTMIPLLGWEKMLHIAIGIAQGLEYLHRGCNIAILHFDIKPHNILLDHEFCPKISDFGLAKLCRSEKHTVSMLGARGTIGYISPEVFRRGFGEISSKSDVYSYGMMLLEMVGGRRNLDAQVSNTSDIYFPNWIYKHFDPKGDLKPCSIATEFESEIARHMVKVGFWCIQTMPEDRPPMSKVVAMLERKIEILEMPPMPVLSSPSRSFKNSIGDHEETGSVSIC